MARYFLESSALVKRYKQEVGTDVVDRLFDFENHELFYLSLAEIEVRKVFYRLWKHPHPGEAGTPISEEAFNALESRLAYELSQMRRIGLTDPMIEKSVSILDTVWLRSVFDLVQLAAYLMTKETTDDLIFVCADERSHLVSAARAFVDEEYLLVPK